LAMAGLGETGETTTHCCRRATGTRRGLSQQSRAGAFQDTRYTIHAGSRCSLQSALGRQLHARFLFCWSGLVSSVQRPVPSISHPTHGFVRLHDHTRSTYRTTRTLFADLEQKRITMWCAYTHFLLVYTRHSTTECLYSFIVHGATACSFMSRASSTRRSSTIFTQTTSDNAVLPGDDRCGHDDKTQCTDNTLRPASSVHLV